MACVSTDILQPVAGIADARTLSDIQDHVNRTAFNWLDRITRLFRCDTRDPGVGDDLKDGIVPNTLWVNTSTNSAFINVDNAAGAAVWLSISGGSGGVADRTSQLAYNEVNPSASAVTTVVTIAPSADTHITLIECSGELFGKFELYENSTLVATKRSAPSRNATFDFDIPWTIANGDTLDVKVTHFNTGKTPTFETGVWGFT